MVDYSKWDQLDVSDDEDEGRGKPRVQRYDAPQTVTIGGKDGSFEDGPSGNAVADDMGEEADDDEPMEVADEDLAAAGPGADHREEVLQCRELGERALRRGDTAEGVRLLEKALRLAGGAECPGLQDLLASAHRQAAGAATPGAAQPQQEARRANGGTVADRYCWSQTRDSLQVNAFVPDGTAARDVRVQVTETSLTVSVGASVVLGGDWEHKVAPEEDPDWEMKACGGRRSIQLTVRKAEVGGLIIWWKRVLKGEPAIAAEDIEDRRADKAEDFAKVWAEAHEMFRQKVKERQPILINADGATGDSVTAMET